MKTIGLVFFSILVAFVFGDEAPKAVSVSTEQKTSLSLEMLKTTKTYSKAKEFCIKQGGESLKGNKLTECIVKYQKEAK